MVLSIIPMVSAAGLSSGGVTTAVVPPEEAPVGFNATRVDLDALRASVGPMPKNAISLQDFFAQKIAASKPEIDMTGFTDEEVYVLETSFALSRPVGAQFDDAGSKHIKAVVWLTELPIVLDRYYQEMGVNDPVYLMAAKSAVSARQNIQALSADPRVTITSEHNWVFSGFYLTAPASLLQEIATWPGVFCVQEEPVYEWTGYDTYIPDPAYEKPGNVGARELFNLDYLHAQGIDGRGVKVGVLDSAILITHPDIVGAYKGGYNYASSTANMNPVPPSGGTTVGEHGMHTAGTIASRVSRNSAARYRKCTTVRYSAAPDSRVIRNNATRYRKCAPPVSNSTTVPIC